MPTPETDSMADRERIATYLDLAVLPVLYALASSDRIPETKENT